MRRAILMILCLVATAAAYGQVARQGDPDAKPNPTAFHSPMILEVPFIVADRSTWGKGWQEPPEYVALGKYTVDNIWFRGATKKDTWDSGLRVRSTPRSNNRLLVELAVTVLNPRNNHDKSVSVFFDFLNGEQSFLTATLDPIGAHDNGSHSSPMILKLASFPIDELKTNPTTTLRLTVTAKDW